MPKFKVGDMVTVKPKFWLYRNHKHEVGIVDDIKPNPIAPYLVKFTATKELFAEDELEWI